MSIASFGVVAHEIGAIAMAQFAQRFGFYLANALARDIKLPPDFFQRMVGVNVNAESHLQDFGLAPADIAEDAGQ